MPVAEVSTIPDVRKARARYEDARKRDGQDQDGPGDRHAIAQQALQSALKWALVHQAALAFELWTGEGAPVAAMRAAVADVLHRGGA